MVDLSSQAEWTSMGIDRDEFSFLVGFASGHSAHCAGRVLEFGPGNSTLAFVQAGCREIVSLESDSHWLDVARRRLAAFPHVRLALYDGDAAEVRLPDSVAGRPLPRRYDLAFVDGPPVYKGRRADDPHPHARRNTLACAARYADTVLCHDAYREPERSLLAGMMADGWWMTVFDSARGLAVLRRG